MSTVSVSAVPLDMLKPVVSAPSVTGASDKAGKLAAITKTAKDFESSFLSSMLGQMFEGLSTDGPFGGGQGEAMFRSVMMDAFGKQITKAGGVGVAAAVQREMLKMQGLG